jgi:N-acetylglucosaminyldiphosphoundecaprenol N-acetyl-beta-D-mannosaminyltransferase
MHRVTFLNSAFDPLTLPQTVDAIFTGLQEKKRGWLCTVNVAILMMMRSNPRLQRFVDQAALIVADGQPLIWFGPLFSAPMPERVTGVDLVDELCARAAREGVGVYLLGATQDIVSRVAQRLQRANPTLKLTFADGYFGAAEAPARAAAIAQSGAQILLVGMGVPRQEQFIEEHWDALGANGGGIGMAIGVGGSFDVLAGLRQRAPMWVQKIGMEWFYRLIQEPRRLFKRYLVTNSQFLALIFTCWLRQAFTDKKFVGKQCAGKKD